MPTSTQLHLTTIGRIVVPSADQDRALEFYRDTLGFAVRTDLTFADGKMRWIEVEPSAGAETAIALFPPMEDGATEVQTGIILETGDIDADHAALKEQGIDVGEVSRMGAPVPPMFTFRDPHGNELAVVEPLAE
jgi:catechol 2,3-dioxygenase-like lactoylglutathione lyase family enzyme